MIIDWGYITIIGVYSCATVAYFSHDGSDPWSAAMYISILILFGKAWVWCFS